MSSKEEGSRVERLRGTIDVDGGQIAYETAGSGAPVLFIHAGIADSRMWDRQVDVFGKDYRVVTFDMRGFGHSPPANGQYSPLKDISDLLSNLHIEKPFLVGCSMGGALAIDFALAHPDKVRGLLLAAPGLSGTQYEAFGPEELPAIEYDDKKSMEIANAWKEGRVADAEELLRQLWCSSLKEESLELFKKMINENREEVFEDRSMQRAERSTPAYGRLGGMHTPTTVLVGDHDNPSMVPFANLVTKGIEGARLVHIKGADHLINLSRPDDFDVELRSALERVGM